MLVNWRLATLECIEVLDIQERRSDYVAEELLTFLAPIINKQVQPQEEKQLRERVLGLCRDAFKLTIMMRKSREEYRCEAKKDRMQSPAAGRDGWVDAQAVDEGKNDEFGDNIAYVLFGALTKHPAYRGESELVLVKAEVVLEKKSL